MTFRITFRCQLVLMLLDDFAYGRHVSDELAFILRCRRSPYLASFPGGYR